MWSQVGLKINGAVYFCSVKHYELPSPDYGIDGGRISKLSISRVGNGVTASYDRGWNIRPTDADTLQVYNQLLAKYN